jgi:hypothetical protein
VGLGELLKKQLLKAIPERNFQRDLLATFTQHQAEHVPAWKAMVEAFEADQTQPNPYELPKSGMWQRASVIVQKLIETYQGQRSTTCVCNWRARSLQSRSTASCPSTM